MAQEGELEDLVYLSDETAVLALAGAAILIGGSAGVAAAPLLLAYAAYFLVGIPATAGVVWGFQSGRRSTMEATLREVDFAGTTRVAVEQRLSPACTPRGDGSAGRVEVVILAYGFTQETEEVCSFVNALIRLDLPDQPPQEEDVIISPADRSPDAPPSYCTSVERLLARDGELARQTLSESAEILGAIVASRLGAGR